MPYFNQLYGEKYTGMLMLARMHLLLNKSVVNVVDKISIVFLAYNITSSGFRQIPLMAKLSVVTGLAENKIELPSFD
jgi:predicted transcriptional regulator